MNEGTDPVEAAESCLAGGESMVLLRIYQFKDDVEAHDDDLQEHLSKSFLKAFHTAASALDIAYGSHTNIDVDNDVDVDLALATPQKSGVFENNDENKLVKNMLVGRLKIPLSNVRYKMCIYNVHFLVGKN